MKKIVSIILLVVLSFSISACGKKEEAPQSMTLVPEVESPKAQAETSLGEMDLLVKAYFENMPDHNYMIGAAPFSELVVAGEPMTIIDIRRADDYEKGHIKGAVNMPWGPAIAEGMASIPTEHPVFIYCYTGQTAGQAVMTLNVAGVEARSVSLGWNLGLSKLENINAISDDVAVTFEAPVRDIAPSVQTAMDAYYGALESAVAPYVNNIISEEALNEKLMAGEDLFVLSTRRENDYLLGHIRGASNVPFGKDMFAGFEGLPKDKKIIAYCYTGQTAGQVTAALRLMGYDVASLYGGMGTAANAPRGWNNSGYPLASEAMDQVVALYQNMPDHINMISSADFMALYEAGESMTLIDMRSADDYAKGHLKGAISMPWGMAVAENVAQIPDDVPVFIYCYTGQTAGQALVTLNLSGLETRSISLGWNFGLSKLDGFDAHVSTDVEALPNANRSLSKGIELAINQYYEKLEAAKETSYVNNIVTEETLKDMLESDDQVFTLVSTRRPDDYASGHIETAINIPFGKDMVEPLMALPRTEKTILYCYTGQTAGQATAMMRLLGYDAASLRGGMGTAANAPFGWANKDFPVVQ